MLPVGVMEGANPLRVLRAAARVVKPGGLVVAFDGDYASLGFAAADAALAHAMDEALIAAVVTNPRVMRDMPRLLREAGLSLQDSMGHLYADIGTGSFFVNVVTTFAPLVLGAGLLPAETVERWRAAQESAATNGTFFGACNHYAYLARRPTTA